MPCKCHTVLVIIDVQGKLAKIAYESESLLRNLKILIKGFKVLGLPILWTEQLPDKLGPTLPEIAELFDDEKPILKSDFSCIGEEKFVEALTKLDPHHVVVAGIETHVCVYQTARDLLEKYEVSVVADAVSSRTEFNKQIGIDKILLDGGTQTSVEMLLFELQKKATGDSFKELIKLVK